MISNEDSIESLESRMLQNWYCITQSLKKGAKKCVLFRVSKTGVSARRKESRESRPRRPESRASRQRLDPTVARWQHAARGRASRPKDWPIGANFPPLDGTALAKTREKKSTTRPPRRFHSTPSDAKMGQ